MNTLAINVDTVTKKSYTRNGRLSTKRIGIVKELTKVETLSSIVRTTIMRSIPLGN